MEDIYKLLEQVHHDASMCVYTIEVLLKELNDKDNRIKPYLNEIIEDYRDYEAVSKNLLEQEQQTAADPSIFAKMGSSMGIKKEVMTDNSDSAIADLMIQGITMGTVEIEKKLNECGKDLKDEHKKIANDFLKFQEKTIEKLKEYL